VEVVVGEEAVAVLAPVKKVEKEGPAAEKAPVKTEEGTAGAGWGFLTGRPLPPDRYPMRATHVAPAHGESTASVPSWWPLLRSSGDHLLN
jgi:hypothetical protein